MSQSQIETLDPSTSTLTLSLHSDLYPRDVLYAAAYVFLDRAYILVDQDAARFVVHVRGKQPLDEAALRAMAGEFENELLAQALRLRVVKANQKIIEDITTLAIAGAAGGVGAEEFEAVEAGSADGGTPNGFPSATDDSMEFLEDPQGIAAPWEPEKKPS